MGIKSYAFIVKAPGYNSSIHRSVLEGPEFRTEVVCVSSVAEAVQVARELTSNGVEVIELCGGFGESGAMEVIDQLGSEVPVGYVVFSKEEGDKLEKLLGAKGSSE